VLCTPFFVLDFSEIDIYRELFVAGHESGLQIPKYGLIQKRWAKQVSEMHGEILFFVCNSPGVTEQKNLTKDSERARFFVQEVIISKKI
jgi:hypothetical protein